MQIPLRIDPRSNDDTQDLIALATNGLAGREHEGLRRPPSNGPGALNAGTGGRVGAPGADSAVDD
jgi:hypothetical protein